MSPMVLTYQSDIPADMKLNEYRRYRKMAADLDKPKRSRLARIGCFIVRLP